MQIASKPDRKQASTKKTQEYIRYFPFTGALPQGHTLVLDLVLGTLSELALCNEGPRQVMKQQFTTSELSLLVPLLESYPYFCPYELMFASFYNGEVTDELLEQCRRRLQVALEGDNWDVVMRPIRNVLSRIRFKLRPFGIDISSLLETGYLLKVAPRPDACQCKKQVVVARIS